MSDYSTLILAEPSLVSYWRLDELAGALADSKGVNIGTTVAGPTYNVPGLIANDPTDGAMLFHNASAQYFTVADNISLALGDTFSFECWLQLTSYTGGVIRTKGPGSFYAALNGAGGIRLGKAGVADIVLSSSTPIGLGSIHHCVWTKSGASVHLYIDGVDVTGVVTNQTIVNSASIMVIGAFNNGAPSAFIDGVLDEVALYSAVLSAADILNHFTVGNSPPAPPTGFYNAEE